MKNYFWHLVVIFMFGHSIKISAQTKNINTKLNKAYTTSLQSFTGVLTEKEYNDIRESISRELDTIIPLDKSIILHYTQGAPNCFFAKYNANDFRQIISNTIRIANELDKKHNAISFHIYTSNSFHSKEFALNQNFKIDAGFFHDQIFTLHDHCNAFLIIKPDGSFLKSYSFDYSKQIDYFFAKK